MKNLFRSLVALVAFIVPLSSFAVVPVEVQNVNFRGVRNDWVQIDVQLNCRENPNPEARDRNFVENIGVTLNLAYERRGASGEFDFYRSSAEILIMERGDTNFVSFFLPGLIVKRDRLPRGEPFAFIVDVTVEGEDVAPSAQAVGSRLRGNEEAINSLRQRAQAGAAETEGILMQSYFAPVNDIGARLRDEPLYRRRDPRP